MIPKRGKKLFRFKKPKSSRNSEHSIQKSFFDYLGKKYGSYRKVCFSIPNEGARSLIQGSLLKQRGLTKGVPDIFCAIPNGNHHGLFIEFKKKDYKNQCDGGLSLNQKDMIYNLRTHGYRCEICYSLDEAIHIFESYI